MIRKITRDEFLRGSMILIVSFAAFNFLNYLFQMLMARLLGPADYGILAVMLSFVYIFSIPTEAIQTIVAKYSGKFNIEKDNGKIRELFSRVLKKAFIFAALSFVIFSLVSIWLSKVLKIDFIIFEIIGLFIFCAFLLPVIRGVLQGKKKFGLLGISMISESGMKVLLSLLLVTIGWKVYGAVFSVFVSSSLVFFFSLAFIKDVLKSRRDTSIKESYSYDFLGLVAIISIVLMYSMDIIFARMFFSESLAGQYAFVSLIGKTILFVNLAIGKAMFPITTENFEKEDKAKAVFKKSVLLTLAISFVALALFLAFPRGIIWIISLGSSQYFGAAGVLFILGLAYSIFSLANLIILYKISMNKLKKSSLVLLVFAIMQAILLIAFHSSVFYFSTAILASAVAMIAYLLITK